MSKELNHFGVVAGLFRQIGGHSSRFVLFCSFRRLFTIKMIKSVKVNKLSESEHSAMSEPQGLKSQPIFNGSFFPRI